MLKKFVFLLVMAVALSCSFSAMAESYKTPAQIVDDASLDISQRLSREVGKGCGYEARVEKHSQAYYQYVENVF